MLEDEITPTTREVLAAALKAAEKTIPVASLADATKLSVRDFDEVLRGLLSANLFEEAGSDAVSLTGDGRDLALRLQDDPQ